MTAEKVELELKYRVANAAAAGRLAATRMLGDFRAAGRTHQVQVEDRYLDTAGGALARAGWAVRLRRGPSMTVISAKSTTPSADALHRREEVEGPAGLSLDPHDWPPSAARSLVLEHAGDAPLVELVTVRQLRRTRAMADETAEIELSLDEVEVVTGGRVVDRFVELEAELRRGPASALDTLAAALAEDPDLEPETSSKLERALAAVGSRGAPRRRARALPPDTPELPREAPAGPGSNLEPTPRAPAPEVGVPVTPDAVPGTEPAAPPTAEAPVPDEAPPATDAPVPDEAPTPTAAEAPTPTASAHGLPAAPSSAARDTAEPGATRRLVVGKSPGVTGDDILAEAGRKVLRFHFARMLAREAGTRSGTDIEDLHGMRVATRRMRAAWRVFGDGFRDSRTQRLRARLRVLAGRLGTVRDFDVLIEGASAHLVTLPAREARAFERLLASWRQEREVARIVLLRELDSAAYERLVEEYRVFVASEGMAVLAPASPVAPHRVRDTAGSRIWLAYEQVRAYESVLRWADIETVHQLRIAAKWLRYTLEFFKEALGPEVEALIPRVVALQDHLGLLHDADVSIAMTRQFLVARAGSLSSAETLAIGGYLATRERDLARLRRTMGAPWRGVAGPQFRRLLGRAVAAL